MTDAAVDAVLLSSPSAAAAIAGHRRVAVHGAAGPLPVAVVTRGSPPHVFTPDPDGAPALPTESLHGIAWDPAGLAAAIRHILGPAAAGTIGVEVISPGAVALLRAALPHATLVDATAIITEALLAKNEREQQALAAACAVAHAAASAGRAGGMAALVAQLGGAFPISEPVLGEDRAAIAISIDGMAGVARIGPGDPSRLDEAVAVLAAGVGSTGASVAESLPDGVAVSGLGCGHELPVLRRGRATPDSARLRAGAVLLVAHDAAAVTIALGESSVAWLSPQPAEVCA
jgi:hypothetical protein